jgi:hypothetical protein
LKQDISVGGIWEPRAFFDAADEFGILLYADLQIAAKQNYSVAGGRNYHKVVPEELDYQIRRLSHHVSLFKSSYQSVPACGGVAPVSRVRLCCATVLFTSIILT